MTDNTFTVDSVDYSIPELYRTVSALFVYLGDLPTTTVVANWRLDIAKDYSFYFSEATRQSGNGRYQFSNADFATIWSSFRSAFVDGATFTVKIVKVPTATAPGAPTNFMATVRDGVVDLSWAAPASDNGATVTKYQYRYSAGSTVATGTSWSDVGDSGDDGSCKCNETALTITSVTDGTQYAFEVRAVNSVGEGTAAGPVTATIPPSLVSNIRQSDDDQESVGSDYDFTQGFTTGAAGATLTSIDIKLYNSSSDQAHPTVTLHKDNATSAAVATLSAPSGTIASGSANYTYTAPSNTTLDASTPYFVVLEGGGSTVNVYLTSSDSEDSGGKTGWSIANTSGFRSANSTGNFTDLDEAVMIRVKGAITIVTVPGAPTSFTATKGDTAVTLSWAAPTSNGGGAITKYRYRYSTGATVSASATWTDVPDGSDAGDSTADETRVTISGLTNGTEYAFEVRAVNSAGEGAVAGSITATPAAPPPALVSNIGQTVSLSSPELGTTQDLSQGFTTVTTAGTLDSIEVKFAAANDGSAHPTVTLHSGSPTSTAIATLTAPSGTIAATAANYTYTAPSNTTLIAATTYYVVLEGSDDDLAPQATTSDNEDSGGETGWSVANGYGFRTASSVGAFTTSSSALLIRVNGTAKAVTTPGAPTSFMARAGDGEVTLSWAPPANIGGGAITNYRYRHSAGSTVVTTTGWTDVPDGSDAGSSAADETGLTITGLTNGTEYAFEVLAENSAGEGAVAEQTATPAAETCAAPSFGTRRELWTGTVTVGAFTVGVDPLAYGFIGTAGGLDDKTFTIGSNSYEIDTVAVAASGSQCRRPFIQPEGLRPDDRGDGRVAACMSAIQRVSTSARRP